MFPINTSFSLTFRSIVCKYRVHAPRQAPKKENNKYNKY